MHLSQKRFNCFTKSFYGFWLLCACWKDYSKRNKSIFISLSSFWFVTAFSFSPSNPSSVRGGQFFWLQPREVKTCQVWLKKNRLSLQRLALMKNRRPTRHFLISFKMVVLLYYLISGLMLVGLLGDAQTPALNNNVRHIWQCQQNQYPCQHQQRRQDFLELISPDVAWFNSVLTLALSWSQRAVAAHWCTERVRLVGGQGLPPEFCAN